MRSAVVNPAHPSPTMGTGARMTEEGFGLLTHRGKANRVRKEATYRPRSVSSLLMRLRAILAVVDVCFGVVGLTSDRH